MGSVFYPQENKQICTVSIEEAGKEGGDELALSTSPRKAWSRVPAPTAACLLGSPSSGAQAARRCFCSTLALTWCRHSKSCSFFPWIPTEVSSLVRRSCLAMQENSLCVVLLRSYRQGDRHAMVT